MGGPHADTGTLKRPWRHFNPPKAEEDSVALLAKRNYKVYADLGFDTTLTVRRVATLDTGAGPNIIRKDQIPDSMLSRLKFGPLPNLTDANRKPLRRFGTISLIVRMGRLLSKVDFIVADPPADVPASSVTILGITSAWRKWRRSA